MWRAKSLKRPWCWERLKAGEEGDRGWDGWTASLIQSTWTWANSGRWGGTGRPAFCSPWDCQQLDTTWRLNNNNQFGITCSRPPIHQELKVSFWQEKQQNRGTWKLSTFLSISWPFWGQYKGWTLILCNSHMYELCFLDSYRFLLSLLALRRQIFSWVSSMAVHSQEARLQAQSTLEVTCGSIWTNALQQIPWLLFRITQMTGNLPPTW